MRRDEVVSRTFAEWCGVIDVLVAAQLLLLAWPGAKNGRETPPRSP